MTSSMRMSPLAGSTKRLIEHGKRKLTKRRRKQEWPKVATRKLQQVIAKQSRVAIAKCQIPSMKRIVTLTAVGNHRAFVSKNPK